MGVHPMLSVVRIVTAPIGLRSNDPWGGIIAGAIGGIAISRVAVRRIRRARS